MPDHVANAGRSQEIPIVFLERLDEDFLRDASLKAEDLLNQADVFILKHGSAGLVQQFQVLVIWNHFWPGLVAAHRLMLLVVAVDDGFVADPTHERNEDFQITVLVTDVFVETRL